MDSIILILLAIVIFVLIGPVDFTFRERIPYLANRRRGGNQRRQGHGDRLSSEATTGRQPPMTLLNSDAKPQETGSSEDGGTVIDGGIDAMRAQRAAAAEARLAKHKANVELVRRKLAERKKRVGMSALEQASYEERGWRRADEKREMDAWN